MTDRDAQVRAVPRTEGTKPVDEGLESMPLDREQPQEAAGGMRGEHSHAANAQADTPLDQGVGTEHLRSTSQGARPEGVDDAVLPDAEGSTTIGSGPGDGDEAIGGGPSGEDDAEGRAGGGPAFEPGG